MIEVKLKLTGKIRKWGHSPSQGLQKIDRYEYGWFVIQAKAAFYLNSAADNEQNFNNQKREKNEKTSRKPLSCNAARLQLITFVSWLIVTKKVS